MGKAFAAQAKHSLIQIPRTCLKPDVVAYICNGHAPSSRWEAEKGNSLEACRPASQVYIARLQTKERP